MGTLPEIPKLYTALAEWLACLLFVCLLKKRFSRQVTFVIMVSSLIVLGIIQSVIGIVPVVLWVPGMLVALAVMYAILLLCCRITAREAGFYWAVAFIGAEFAASLEWQAYCILEALGLTGRFFATLILLLFYGGIYAGYYRLERGRLRNMTTLEIRRREVASAVIIAFAVFFISNISYISTETPFSGSMSMEIFYIRTLVDFAGVIMLYSQQDQLIELQMTRELDSIQTTLQLQYEQYRQSRENIEAIHRKYHDLKHQIGIIRMETDEEKREEYLRQLESGVQHYAAEQKTGNPVLDTILTGKQLYCQQHEISMNIVADGSRLNFMDTMDICSIFGNALDNAIESVEKIKDSEKRLIHVIVHTQNQFLMIRVENYFETPLNQIDGEFHTTKQKEIGFHGFGLKSIRYTAEKYEGNVSVSTEDNWFHLRVLFPLNDI